MPNEPLLLASPPMPKRITRGTAFGCPRDFLDNHLIYAVISPRAKGLSIGVNMNPDGHCNFDCAYCEVNRIHQPEVRRVDVEVVTTELQKTLALVRSGEIKQRSFFSTVPDELLKLRHVALSGDGEPTLCPNFTETVQTVMYVRARSASFFKVVLITNSVGLDQPDVQNGLQYFTREDEIWAKLDAGTQSYMHKVNGPGAVLDRVLTNILLVSRHRPVIIQGLFPSINGQEPPPNEIMEYALRLKELKDAGAQIPLVQIYSATRPTPHSECGHLPLKTLSHIAQTVRKIAGLEAEIF